MNKVFPLSDQIAAHVIHFAPIAVGVEIYRIIYELYTEPRPSGGLIKEYEVWVSDVYIEDHEHLTHEPTQEEILDFANKYLIDRYKYSGNNVPVENGAYLTNETGEIRGNPRTFPLKASDKRNKLIKTTLMLPQETHKWLKSYGEEKGISLGDTIRRVVADFQAGTARHEEENQKNINSAGAATYNDNQKK